MKEPEKFPLTNNPKIKQTTKHRLYPETTNNDIWSKSLDHEDNLENNSQSIQELGAEQTD